MRKLSVIAVSSLLFLMAGYGRGMMRCAPTVGRPEGKVRLRDQALKTGRVRGRVNIHSLNVLRFRAPTAP